jgi:hypothetical protein
MDLPLVLIQAMAAGAIAAVPLFLGRRRISRWVGYGLGVVAITGIFVAVANASCVWLMVLFMGTLHAVGLNEDGGVGVGRLLFSLSEPFRHVFRHGPGDLVRALDASWWSLLQCLAATAIVAYVDRLPLSGGAARLRASLERSWPDGWGAALSMVVAALVLVGLPVLLRHWVSPTLTVGLGLMAIALLRYHRPLIISWGAWALAMMALPSFILQFVPAFVLRHAGGDWTILILTTIAAVLVLAGPRHEPRGTSWFWLLSMVLLVLPGLGWIASPFLFSG